MSTTRSELMKAVWRKRKREGGKAICFFCKKPIFAGGVAYQGRKFHKSCLESMKFGLTKKQAGVANPKRRTRDSYEFYGARELNPRPPARWWAIMWSKTAASYPRKAGETLKHYRASISRIVAGIWWKFDEATRKRLIKKYERMATPSKALNPKVGYLPCPSCGTFNPISKQNVYLKCYKCNSWLQRVNVRRK